ncbi:MAG: dihydrofolate reductase family protein [Pirellulales bacterium]
MRTVRETPLLVIVGPDAKPAERERLADAGCEVRVIDADEPQARLREVLLELGRRRCTNVLVEGGSRVLGSLLDGDLIDEIHAYVAPKVIGGFLAPSPVAGVGHALMAAAVRFPDGRWHASGPDMVYVGRREMTHHV